MTGQEREALPVTAPQGLRWASGGGHPLGGCNGYHLAKLGRSGTLCGRMGPHTCPDPLKGQRICGNCARIAKMAREL